MAPTSLSHNLTVAQFMAKENELASILKERDQEFDLVDLEVEAVDTLPLADEADLPPDIRHSINAPTKPSTNASNKTIHPPIHRYHHPTIYRSAHPPIYPPTYLPTHPSTNTHTTEPTSCSTTRPTTRKRKPTQSLLTFLATYKRSKTSSKEICFVCRAKYSVRKNNPWIGCDQVGVSI